VGRQEVESNTLSRILRAPALHFVVLGVAAYAIAWAMPTTAPPGSRSNFRIHLTAADVARLKVRYTGDTGLVPDAPAVRALIDREINEEILYREALALGLDRIDRAIAWRLIEKMEYLGESVDQSDEQAYERARSLGLDRNDPVVRRVLIQKIGMLIRFAGDFEKPDDESLRRYLQEHSERFTEPARIDLAHVYFDRAKRGPALESDATAALSALRENGEPRPGERLPGDAFLAGHRFENASRQSLAKLFGEPFAEFALAADAERWSGPVASPGGLHLLWVRDKTTARVSDLESVRDRVTRAVSAQRRDDRLREFLQARRTNYTVIVDEEEAGHVEG
jgi:hypothetical protein